jgi:choline dehydrogenase-like flavoprotein
MASSASETSTDLCILGSGIAGMLLAERALLRGRRVLMIERGTALSFEDRIKQKSHNDPLPFNKSPLRMPHEGPPRGPRVRWDRDYPYWPVYNLGGCTNSFFGNMPRWHPSHFEQPAFAGGADRRWPITYAALEPYYLQAEHRLAIAGNSTRTPFQGRFAYPLPPHRLSPSDRACATLFGQETVVQVPTTRPSQSVGSRPECCGTNRCDLCPIDSKGTALNMLYPSLKSRIDLRTGLLATTVHARQGQVQAVSAVDASGRTHRIHARQFVVACNGVDSCLLLQRSPDVPQLPALGRYYMDHPLIQLAIYDSGVDAKPGYGDSAQTGMFVPFFERVADDLPVSMLGEIRCASLSEPHGSLMRDILMREIVSQALSAPAGANGIRASFRRVWRSTLDLWFLVEPQPLADQTVSIDRIEQSGQPIPQLHLRYPSYFVECVDRLLQFVRRRLPRATVAHVGSIPTSFHWMGATRMAAQPEHGCVDANLQYHELENLFVLSTSVFPSASSANPTLTLAALSLRLGDHLERPDS